MTPLCESGSATSHLWAQLSRLRTSTLSQNIQVHATSKSLILREEPNKPEHEASGQNDLLPEEFRLRLQLTLSGLEDHPQRQRHVACSGCGGGHNSVLPDCPYIAPWTRRPAFPRGSLTPEPSEKHISTRGERTRQKAKSPRF